jgi:F0F1-type ATP synthase assembly protein I
MAAAYSMTGSVLGIGALGYFLDRYFEWNNYGLVSGIFLGVFVGMYELYKSVFISKDGK